MNIVKQVSGIFQGIYKKKLFLLEYLKIISYEKKTYLVNHSKKFCR